MFVMYVQRSSQTLYIFKHGQLCSVGIGLLTDSLHMVQSPPPDPYQIDVLPIHAY
jgi:hypothetical protein